ncbi:NAD(P)-binding domain-containing protein [bacterium]|nr:NAD(P)-binding domain-containing protein [bacterium]
MELPNVGLVGAGRIARILLNGWARAGALPGRVVACDINSAACEALRSVCAHLEASTEASLACRQEVVFLAVHPPVIKDVAPVLKQHLAPESTLVSLAPKLTLAKLTEMLGGFARIARVIPNAPSLVGRGFNPVAFGPGLPGDARRDLEHLLAPLGDCPEVPEEHLEAYAILAAMGPTYSGPSCMP